MANVVAPPEIQPKLQAETEIRHVVVIACAGIQLQLDDDDDDDDEHLPQMPYR